MKISLNKKKYSLISLCLVSLVASIVVVNTLIFPQQSPDPRHGPAIDKLRFQVYKGPPPPDEVLYVDSFTLHPAMTWTLVGDAPYLDDTGDGNYIVGDHYCDFALIFGFENITLGPTDVISRVVLEHYATAANPGIDADVYTWEPTFWDWLGSLEAVDPPAKWRAVTNQDPVNEVNSTYGTEEGLNALEIAIHYWTPDGSDMGPFMLDALRLKVWFQEFPDTWTRRVEAMQNGAIDVLTDIIRPSDIEKLDSEHYTMTSTPGFQITHVGFNLHRPVLDDVNFRHALFHGYRQEEIIASIYRYTVTPVQSLIPYTQGGWMAPDIPKHPFNPGDPLDTTVYPQDHSLSGILRFGGYEYHGTGYGDTAAYWTDPLGDPLPHMDFYTPTYEAASTEADHGSRIISEWHRCGLNNIDHQPMDFNDYTHLVFDLHDFDIYMMSWDLDRFPTHLYRMCHSSTYLPGSDHAVGLQDPVLDDLLETLKYSLDHEAKMEACHEAQRRLYDPEKTSWACAYMNLYSKVYFNAFNPGLRGIVNSAGYGSDNMWTFLNMHWQPGHPNERIENGKSTVVWCLNEEPIARSPLASSTEYEWALIGRVYDSLIAVNPYTHDDLAWQAESWTVEAPITTTITLDSDNDYMGLPAGSTFDIIDGMRVTFNLIDGLYWQDGNPVVADDCEFGLEFLRDNQIPQYVGDWQHIVDVQVIDNDEFVVYADVTSQFLLYDWADAALLLPSQVWSWLDGQPVADILAYDPTTDYTDTGPWSYPDGPDGVPGTGDDPDPTNIGPKTRLFGTGPYVYDYYVDMIGELHNWDAQGANVGYFKTTQEISEPKTEMFWACGDVNRDGVVDLIDIDRYLAAFMSTPGDPNWDPDCDLNFDDIIDWTDGSIINVHWGTAREYPAEIIDVEILDLTTYPTAIPGQTVEISLTAKYKGLVDREVNFTYYYNDTILGYKNVTWAPGMHALPFTWDTTGIPLGTYTIKVNSTILDDPARPRLSDPTYIDGDIEFVEPLISTDPDKSVVGSAGKDFSVNITITNAPYNNTWAWQFKLSWDPNILNITDINEGTFLNQSGTWATSFVNVTNQEEGWVLASCTLIDDPIEHGQPLPYGNGTLAIVNFTVLNPGSCTLHLYDTILLDYNIDSYSHTTQDGEFEVLLGDINRDGIVDDTDLQTLEQAFGSTPGDPDWNPEADIWGPNDEPDGIIDVYDLAMLGKKYGETA